MELAKANSGNAIQPKVSKEPSGITTPIKAIRFSGAVGFIFASMKRPSTNPKSERRRIAAAVNDHAKVETVASSGVAHRTVAKRKQTGRNTPKRSHVSILANVQQSRSSMPANGEKIAHPTKKEIAMYGRIMISILFGQDSV